MRVVEPPPHSADRSFLFSFAGSHIGSKQEAIKMLNLAAEKNIKPWIEVMDMKECPTAIQRVEKNDVRYRFVLRQDIEPVE